MYWAYQNFKICVICASNIPKTFQKCFKYFLNELLVRHPFVDVCEFGFCNTQFLFMVAFVDVCLEVADFSMMFACWDFIEPIRYGVCDVYVGFGG